MSETVDPLVIDIESDAGYRVSTVYEILVYTEGDKKTKGTVLYSRPGPIPGVVRIGEYSEYWDPPFDGVKITDDDWRRIAGNIREAYRSRGYEISVTLASPEERESNRRAIETVNLPPKPEAEWTAEDREMVERVLERHRRVLERTKHCSSPSFAGRCFALFRRPLEWLKRALSPH